MSAHSSRAEDGLHAGATAAACACRICTLETDDTRDNPRRIAERRAHNARLWDAMFIIVGASVNTRHV
jgi:hypothetical protein